MQRWVLARLRHRRFFSLAELNGAIRELIVDLNDRPMRHLGTTRRALFEAIERDTLLAMPAEPYAYAEWRRCRAGLDYHVEVYEHFYSVPYRLMREVIDARITDQTIELFHNNERIACHVPQSTAAPAHHDRRAHAELASPPRRVDANSAGCARPRRSVRPPSRWSSASSPPSRIPNRGFAPALGSCAWSAATGPSGWRLLASAASTSAPAPTARCSRSCGTVSTRPTAPNPCPTSCPSSTRTSAAAATTIEEHPMLTHPTSDRLRELGLVGMARALEEQRRHPDAADLGFEDRLAILVEREALERDTKRLATRLKFAGLRQQATPEDVDHRAARGLDRGLFQKLTSGEWIERHQDLLVTGPTGTGKTWLSCALGHRACRDNRSVLYQRVPRLLEALGVARGDGRYARMLKSLARVQLLILDDWAITPLTAEQRRDLMEIVDDRHDRASTIVTSQVPVELWHEHIGNPTIADAVLDRLVHGAHRLELKGESMRKLRAAKAKLDETAG